MEDSVPFFVVYVPLFEIWSRTIARLYYVDARASERCRDAVNDAGFIAALWRLLLLYHFAYSVALEPRDNEDPRFRPFRKQVVVVVCIRPMDEAGHIVVVVALLP